MFFKFRMIYIKIIATNTNLWSPFRNIYGDITVKLWYLAYVFEFSKFSIILALNMMNNLKTRIHDGFKHVCNFFLSLKLSILRPFWNRNRQVTFPAKQASMHTFDIFGYFARLLIFRSSYLEFPWTNQAQTFRWSFWL